MLQVPFRLVCGYRRRQRRGGGKPRRSVGAGRTLTVSLDLAEALFDAGYELHNDAAVEDLRDSPSEIVLPRGTEGLSRPVAGGCIAIFTCEM
ncbi:hypothetical protein [Rhodovulum sulfidophilum]|uniref:hypothetical protein n=1 Tax=Rhodovulum sulfidophilum TaxID=35806 RepID=UPI002115D3A0|nr:hypothetical protein [Rhodovulum sulfidophilum]